jgi:hypothetical protein
MQPVYRRRRKRARTAAAGSENSQVQPSTATTSVPSQKSRTTSKLITSFEEDEFRFSDGWNLAQQSEIPPRACLPIFLEERRSGLWTGRRKITWQAKMLMHKEPTKKQHKQGPILKRTWRPYASRRVPFTRLGTPESDAVLALDRTADVVLSLGGKGRNAESTLALALRFYGK